MTTKGNASKKTGYSRAITGGGIQKKEKKQERKLTKKSHRNLLGFGGNFQNYGKK